MQMALHGRGMTILNKYTNTNTKMQVVIHGWGMSALNNDQVEPVDDMALK